MKQPFILIFSNKDEDILECEIKNKISEELDDDI